MGVRGGGQFVCRQIALPQARVNSSMCLTSCTTSEHLVQCVYSMHNVIRLSYSPPSDKLLSLLHAL